MSLWDDIQDAARGAAERVNDAIHGDRPPPPPGREADDPWVTQGSSGGLVGAAETATDAALNPLREAHETARDGLSALKWIVIAVAAVAIIIVIAWFAWLWTQVRVAGELLPALAKTFTGAPLAALGA